MGAQLSSTGTSPVLRKLALVCALGTFAGLALPADAAAQRMLIRDFLPVAPQPVAEPTFVTAADIFASDFLTTQLRHPRVVAARIETRFSIRQLYEERGIAYPAAELFIRIFKRERVLELWAREQTGEQFALLKKYPICALTGEPGPKRKRGDLQTPEGFYEINRFNPNSAFHLSLHINYPNRSDRLLGERSALGGDIFIHGGCQTEGCIAVTDDNIKELYWIAVEARAAGQRTIPVHIFPFRLTDEDLEIASGFFADQPHLIEFWRSLQPGYAYFEETRTIPRMGIDGRGLYVLGGDVDPARADDEPRLLGRPVDDPR
jgi:murein L,D-transpeptidase YafK